MNTGPQQSNESPQQGGPEQAPAPGTGYGDSKPPRPRLYKLRPRRDRGADLYGQEVRAPSRGDERGRDRPRDLSNPVRRGPEEVLRCPGGRRRDLTAIRKVLDELVEQLRCRLTDTQRGCLEQATTTCWPTSTRAVNRPAASPRATTPGWRPGRQRGIAELAAEIARRGTTWQVGGLLHSTDRRTGRHRQGGGGTEGRGDKAGGRRRGRWGRVKVVRWYARWLILDARGESKLGRGFESVTAYIDCLCTCCAAWSPAGPRWPCSRAARPNSNARKPPSRRSARRRRPIRCRRS